MVPLASLTPMPYGVIDAICTIGNWIANVFNGTIDTIGINEANGSPMLSLAPMTPMEPMNRHLQQWLTNVSNGAIDANDVIDAVGFHWRLWKTHYHKMAPI